MMHASYSKPSWQEKWIRPAAAMLLMLAGSPAALAAWNGIEFQGCRDRLKDVKSHYPIISTDVMEILYVDGCLMKWVWDDSGDEKRESVAFYEVDYSVLPPEYQTFSTLGHYIHTGEMKGNYDQYATFLLRAKNGSSNVLAGATKLEEVWKDDGSGAHDDVSVWEFKCPADFVSLGLVANRTHDQGSFPNVACVQRNYTGLMDIHKPNLDRNGSIWAAPGKAHHQVAFYSVAASKIERPKNMVLLPPATFWAKKDSYDPPDREKFRGLWVPLQPAPMQPQNSMPPKLTGPSTTSFDAGSGTEPEKGFTVSALVMHDPYYENDLARLMNSPQYYVVRKSKWKAVDEGLLCPSDSPENCTYHRSASEEVGESTTWNNTVGVALTQSLEVDAEFEPLGIGAGSKLTLSIEESYSHEFGGEDSKSHATGTESEFPVRPGQFAVAMQSYSEFSVYRKNDTNMNRDNLVRQYSAKGPIHLATWAPKVLGHPDPAVRELECADSAKRTVEACGFPAEKFPTISVNTPIYNKSRSHYLILTKAGALEVRKGDVGKAQHAHVWSLDQHHAHGKHGNAIIDVNFADGQLTVRANALAEWVSTDEKAPGAMLDITDDGNLVIVDSNSADTIWNSSYDEDSGE